MTHPAPVPSPQSPLPSAQGSAEMRAQIEALADAKSRQQVDRDAVRNGLRAVSEVAS